MTKQVFIALDFSDVQETMAFLEQFPADVRPAVKVGMALFYREGPAIVRQLKAAGFTVFWI